MRIPVGMALHLISYEIEQKYLDSVVLSQISIGLIMRILYCAVI